MNIDTQAPIVEREEICIQAPAEKVWAVLTGIERWPEWQEGVTTARLEAALAEGAVFRWKSGGLNIRSTIEELRPGESIGWTGKALGTRVIHGWSLRTEGEGTRVVTEESMDGWLPRLLKLFTPDFLQTAIKETLQMLKARSEQD